MKKLLALLCAMMLLASAAGAESAVITVDAGDVLHDMSGTLYGLFFEDINHAADGGLYAELLNNRSFEYEDILNPQRFDHYAGWEFGFGGGEGTISLMDEDPLNGNNPHYVRVKVKQSGFIAANAGYDSSYAAGGVLIVPDTDYDFSVYLRAVDYEGDVAVSLMNRRGQLLSDTVTLTPGSSWQKFADELSVRRDPADTHAYFTLTFLGTGEIDIDMASLMPRERTGRRWPGGGMRTDLVEALKALHPSFLRFPGGCVAEGSYYRSNFYNWKDTVGPVEERRENFNTWGYMQSYGIGYYEYFCLCEEIGALPLPVVHAGVLCQMRETKEPPLRMNEMDDYVQDVLDLVEFARGGTDTTWGALRARMGHPEPFDLRYLAIGNENIGDVYFARFDVISKAVRKAYPDITTIVSAGPWADNAASWSVIRSRYADSIADEHYYMDSDWFLDNTHRYDSYPRATQVFLGEYAAHEPVVSGKRPNDLYSALCEAAYLTAIERNSDVVAMCCYAPLLSRSGMSQWSPDLIWFTADSVLLTPNYYIQQMFAATAGKQVVASTLTGAALYQVATRTDECVYVKVVNVSDEPCALTLALSGVADGEAAMVQLSGERQAQNTFSAPDKLAPVTAACTVADQQLALTLPAYSATVFTLPLAK